MKAFAFSPFFPWRLFRNFVLVFVGLVNLLFVLVIALDIFILEPSKNLEQWYPAALVFIPLSVLMGLIFGYRFARPLQSIVIKALRLASKKQFTGVPKAEEVEIEDTDEYHELSLALEKIRKKLKKRRIQLAQEREESLALMTSLEDAVVSVGLDEKIKFYNSRFATQFLEKSQLINTPEGEISLADVFSDPALKKAFIRAWTNGETQTQQVKLMTKLEVAPKYFSLTISPIRMEKNNAIYGALALFHDITEIKRAEHIRNEFVENASHELRTPLTSIKGFVATLKDDIQAGQYDQAGHFIDIVSRNVNRLTDLVNDLLSLAALEANQAFHREKVDLVEVTQDAIESLAQMASSKDICMISTVQVDFLMADRKKLMQVLQNLIGNAIKYIPSKGTIEIRWVVKEDKFIELHVKDDGPGISEEHVPRLFERFYRVDKGRSRDEGGTGLGLAIVKHLVQAHGGYISVKSSLGHGCEFICAFPVHPEV